MDGFVMMIGLVDLERFTIEIELLLSADNQPLFAKIDGL